VSFDQEGDAVTFYARGAKGGKAQMDDLVKGKPQKRIR